MPGFDDIKNWFNDSLLSAERKKQQQSVDMIKAQNEGEKLKLKTLETQANIEKNKYKDQADALKTQTETLGLELDNKEKKENILERVLGQVVPGTGATAPPATAGENETQKPAGKPDPAQQSDPAQQPDPAQQEPKQSDWKAGLPSSKDLIKQVFKAMDIQEQANIRSLGARSALIDQQERATKHLTEARKTYESRINKNLALREELVSQVPTYQSALSNVNWLAKIASVMDASMNGHLRESPTYMLDQFVAKELHSQQAQYQARAGLLDERKNAYQQFYGLAKDEYEAQTSTTSFLYKAMADQLKSLAGLTDTPEKKLMLMQAVEDAEQKSAMAEKMFEVKQKQFAIQEARKSYDSETKRMDMQRKTITDMEKIKQGWRGLDIKEQTRLDKQAEIQRKLASETQQKTIKLGDTSIVARDKKGATAIRDAISNNKQTFVDIRILKAKVGKIKSTTQWKALFAPLPGKFGDKELARNRDLNKSLITAMLKKRVDFTGGGNMTDKEQERLRDFFEVKEGVWVLKDFQKISKILLNKWAGKYDQLFNLLQKESFGLTYKELEKNSDTFKEMSKKDQFKEVAKALGLNAKETKHALENFTTGLGLN